MAIRIWSWLGSVKRQGRKSRGKRSQTMIQRTRLLLMEPLEARELLSVGSPWDNLLARSTPNPHPTGDQPQDGSQMITLSAYTPKPVAPDMGLPEVDQFNQALRQIDDGIMRNPQARPSYWGEATAAGGDQYRLHFCDNGMLITQWTVDFGDGSDPQTVLNKPWIVHAYPGNSSQYAIIVTANGMDGTFTGGMATPRGADQQFNAGSSNTMNRHGPNPNWATQIGAEGQQTTNFEEGSGFDQASPWRWTTAASWSSALRTVASSGWFAIWIAKLTRRRRTGHGLWHRRTRDNSFHRWQCRRQGGGRGPH